jgi:hypothetical protein
VGEGGGVFSIGIFRGVGNLSPAMGARNQVGIGLYRPASLCSLATQFQTRFQELIPRPIAGLKFSTLVTSINNTVDSVVDLDPHGVALILLSWIRIRIGNADPYSFPSQDVSLETK